MYVYVCTCICMHVHMYSNFLLTACISFMNTPDFGYKACVDVHLGIEGN